MHPHCQGARYNKGDGETSFACCRNCIEEERSSPGQDDGGDDVADDPQDGEGRLGHALNPEGELRKQTRKINTADSFHRTHSTSPIVFIQL